MKKASSVNLKSLPKTLSKLLYRFHIVLFVVVVVGGMAVVMFMLNQTINRATDTSNVTQSAPVTFDQETIKRLNELETGSGQTSLNFPNGRINPFSE